MADDEAPEGTPEGTPEEEASPTKAYEAQVMQALEQTDQQAQAIVDKMMSGDLTEQEGRTQLKTIRDQATNAGVVYGQQQGGLNQVKSLLHEMQKGGASEATVNRFQKRVDKVFAGRPDAELGGDLVEEIRTGKPAISTPRTKGGARRTDDELLLDKSTPMERVREIRKRQKAASGW